MTDEAYRRYKGFMCSKWEDELPNVDFAIIEEQTGLFFDEDSRKAVRWLVGGYERDLQKWETLPAKDVKQQLKAIVKACNTLESVLNIGNAGWVGDALANPVELAVWYKTSPKVLDVLKPACRRCHHFPSVDDGKVAEFLSEWRERAQALLGEKGSAGRPVNHALQHLLRDLHALYKQNGGEGLGCYRDRETDEYRGSFLELAHMLLGYTSEPLPLSTLASYIEDNKGLLVQKETIDPV
jgi:hypothetical protein